MSVLGRGRTGQRAPYRGCPSAGEVAPACHRERYRSGQGVTAFGARSFVLSTEGHQFFAKPVRTSGGGSQAAAVAIGPNAVASRVLPRQGASGGPRRG
jgi:hypothetical protein